MKNILITFLAASFLFISCHNNKAVMDEQQHKNVQRFGMVVKIKKDRIGGIQKIACRQ